jgi:phosphatidylinositol-4,5-bisphosphate 3-kinase
MEGLLALPSIRTQMDINNQVAVDFLFPNGILVPLSVNYFSPMDQIKQIIWREVHNYPLAHNLMSEDSYSFIFINKHGDREEVLDESQNLEELQPFLGLFQVVKKKGDTKSKTLDKNINFLIGRGLQKQESFQAAEMNHFKEKMSELCKLITTQRRSQTPLEKFMWRYPVRLRSTQNVPKEVELKITNGCIVVDVGFKENGVLQTKSESPGVATGYSEGCPFGETYGYWSSCGGL